MKLNPSQSHYVLQVLISQGRIRAGQVRKALKNREREIRSLREKLAALEKLSPPASGGSRRRRGAASRRVRRARLSPKVRALRRLQGKYMGYVRRLKAGEKARVRSVREKQGMLAAIKLARSLAKS